MASPTQFAVKSVVLDVTVEGLDAGQTLTSPQSGSSTSGTNGSIKVTTNSIDSTSLSAGYAWDLTDLYVVSPQASDGTFPDVQFTIINNTTNLSDTLYLDGSNKGNIFPRADYTKGLQHIVLGFPLRELLIKGAARGGVSNLPLKATGIKVASGGLAVEVTSTAGWSSPNVPMRIIGVADVLQDADLAALDGLGYNGAIDIKVPGFPEFQTVHTINGPISQNWNALPGGNHQGSVKVSRRINFAYNNAAVSATGVYIFSGLNGLRGASGNIASTKNDLGDYFVGSGSAFLWQEFGVNLYATGTEARVAMQVNQMNVPQDTQHGTPISTGWNKFAYAAIATNGQGSASSDEYLRVPPVTRLGQFLAFQNGVAPVIYSGNGSSISANDVSVVKGGVLINQG